LHVEAKLRHSPYQPATPFRKHRVIIGNNAKKPSEETTRGTRHCQEESKWEAEVAPHYDRSAQLEQLPAV